MRGQDALAGRGAWSPQQLRLSLQALQSYRSPILLVLLTIAVDTAFTIAFFYGIKVLIDAAVGGRDESLMIQLVVGLSAFYVVTTAANVSREYMLAGLEVRLATDLRLSMLSHLQRVALDYHRHTHSSDLLARFSTDVTAIKHALARALPTVIRYGLQVLAVTVLLFFLEWRLALIVLLVLGLTGILVQILATRATQLSPRQARDQATVLATVQDLITGHMVFKVFGRQRHVLERFKGQLTRLAESDATVSIQHRLITRVIESAVSLTQLIAGGAGVWLIFHHSLSAGTLTAFIGLLGVLGTALIRIALGLPDWLSSSAALRQVGALLAEEPGVTDAPDATQLPPMANEIRMDGVTFRYADGRFAVRDVTFAIPAGHLVALVGRNGSGKSTLLALLLRLWDPQEGRVSIDGYDLRAVTQDSLYAQFGVVFQETMLLRDTVRENIRLGRSDATDAEVEAAARAVRIHDAILALPHGYDTVVGDRGGYLSGGHRQRVALARALLRNPRVLVLDEATSALDPASEAAFNEILDQVTAAHTVIVVTHRLTSTMHADHIVVVDGGRVVEQGRHEYLLAREGVYRDLWNRQAGFIISKSGLEARVTIQRVRHIPLFGSLDDVHLTRLADQFTSEMAAAGQVIIEEGTLGDTFYLIVRGAADVVRMDGGEERQIDNLQDGDYFGEIALLAETPRTATVRARTPCLLLTLKRGQFQELIAAAPEVRSMMDELARERLMNIEASRGQRPG